MYHHYYDFDQMFQVMATAGPAFILWCIIIPGFLLALMILLIMRLFRGNSVDSKQLAAYGASLYEAEKNRQLIFDLNKLMKELEERLNKLEKERSDSGETGEAGRTSSTGGASQ